MMNYETFKEELLKEVQKRASSDFHCRLSKTRKNNSNIYDVLCIEEEGVPAVPAIYLDRFYRTACEGTGITEISDMILREYENIRENTKKFSPDHFLDYTKASGHIYCRLINAKMNREFLDQLPWRPYLDLAEVYYYELKDTSIPDGTILITKSHLEVWKISEQELKRIAWINTLRDKAYELCPLGKVLEEIAGTSDIPGFWEESDPSMYILTNRERNYGAAAISYPGILEEIARCVSGSYYLIPSSIHEFLILRADCIMQPGELNEMIRSINKETVAPCEILSDHCYYYDSQAHSLS